MEHRYYFNQTFLKTCAYYNHYIDSYLYSGYNKDIDINLYLLPKNTGGYYEV